MSPIGISNVSLVVTALEEFNASEPRKVPPLEADQNDTCDRVSLAAAVQVTAALFVIVPPDAALKVTACRVVVPDTAVVPALPGSAVCNWA